MYRSANFLAHRQAVAIFAGFSFIALYTFGETQKKPLHFRVRLSVL
jgi:hypothetical protein